MQNIVSFSELNTRFPELKACFFDMDGTLMFTEHLHAMAINQLISLENENKFELDTLERICIGLNDEVVYQKLRKDQYFTKLSLPQFIDKKKRIFSNLLKEIEPSQIFREEVRTLLKDISDKNCHLALVTSSERDTTYELIKFLDIEKYFDKIITREDTPQNKPHPAPYELAMKSFNLSPKDCLIFEDSNVGRESAKSSGANLFEVSWYEKL